MGIYIQNPIEDNYIFDNGKLKLKASNSTLLENNQPTFIGIRQESPNFLIETEIDVKTLSEGCKAGLTVYQIHDDHLDFSLRKSNADEVEIVIGHILKTLEGEKTKKIDNNIQKIKLRISCNNTETYIFEYSSDGTNYVKIAEHKCSLVSTEVGGGFTGVVIGMFAEGKGTADFSYLTYTES